MFETCPMCNGDGHEYMLPSKPCLHCNGQGKWPAQYWYFTFGACHGPRPGYGNRYIKFLGTRDTARAKMMARFGNQWAMQYDEATFLPQIERYSLKELV